MSSYNVKQERLSVKFVVKVRLNGVSTWVQKALPYNLKELKVVKCEEDPGPRPAQVEGDEELHNCSSDKSLYGVN